MKKRSLFADCFRRTLAKVSSIAVCLSVFLSCASIRLSMKRKATISVKEATSLDSLVPRRANLQHTMKLTSMSVSAAGFHKDAWGKSYRFEIDWVALFVRVPFCRRLLYKLFFCMIANIRRQHEGGSPIGGASTCADIRNPRKSISRVYTRSFLATS